MSSLQDTLKDIVTTEELTHQFHTDDCFTVHPSSNLQTHGHFPHARI